MRIRQLQDRVLQLEQANRALQAAVEGHAAREEECRGKARLLEESQRIAHVGSWTYDPDGASTWSDEMYRIYGVSPDTFTPTAESFLNLIHPDDRAALHDWTAACLGGASPTELELRAILPDRTVRVISTLGELVRGDGTMPRHMAGTAHDITERKRAASVLRRLNRALHVLTDCNQLLVRASVEDELLQRICGLLVDGGGYRMAWVGFAESDEAKTVRPVAQAGFEAGYLESVSVTWADEALGRGPAGTAIRTGTPSIARNIPLDAAFAPWREAAVKRGYSSCIGLPLTCGDQVIGVLMIYAAELDAFDSAEVELMTELAADLSFGLRTLRDRAGRERIETAVVESEARLRTVLESVALLGLVLDPGGRITLCSDHLLALTGWKREDVLGADWFEQFLPPDERGLIRNEIFGRAIEEGELPARHENEIVTRLGERRLIAWSNAVFRDVNGRVAGVVSLGDDITERKQMEAALGKSEERFANAFQLSPLPSSITRMNDDRIIEVNEAFCSLFGYARDELIGRGSLEMGIVAPSTRHAVTDEFGRTGIARGIETTARTKAGETRHFLSSARPIEFAGEPCVLAMSVDITERMQVERARRESEQLLRLATEEGGVAVWEYDFNSDTMERSGNHDALYGLEPQETWRLDTFLNATHPEDREFSRSAIQSAVSPGGSNVYQFDFRVVYPDASIHWLSVEGTVVERNAQGQGTLVRGSLIDITDRKLAEEQLRRTAADLRLHGAALNAAANAIMISDRDGTIEWVNPAFTAMSGYGADEAIGRNPRDIVKSGAHDRPFYEAMWSTLLAEGVWHGEITNRRKDGTLYPELMSVTPVRDAKGDITNFIAIKEDLTERRRLEATLAQSQRLETVGSLAGGIAHDFNNLLTVINGAAELAAHDLPRESPLYEATATIRSAADRAAALTRQLLAFSRKQFLQPVVVKLNTLVKNFQPMVRRLIREDIEIHVELSRDAGNVRVDVAQLDQVLLNLVVNGRDAMPNGGTLTIETGFVVLDASDARVHSGMTPGPHAMLAVTDTGIGMDEATQRRMFDPFFTTKEPGKGTGLGMATVYGIVKQSGGSIWTYSEVGRGTTIKVYLPHVAEAAAAVTEAKVGARARGTETILVVDDEAAVRNMAARILETSGYRVRTVASGAAAVKLLEDATEPIHLMLTDLVMPGMSGLELAKRTKSLRPDVKIIVTSGYLPDGAELAGAISAGVQFISKPYSLAELTNKTREVLDAPPTV